MRATVLFSGGIDSTSCIHLLKQDGYDVSGLFIDFNQPASRKERQCTETLSKTLEIPLQIIEVKSNTNFESGELLGRNSFFVFSAILLGNCIDGLLTLGIHAGTPYFDCSPAFLERIDPLVQECTDGKVSLVAPFLHWSKDDVYSFFLSSGLPLSQTYSCEAGNAPCGECASCKDRSRLECLPNDAL